VTRYAANIDKISGWADRVETEIVATQALATLPQDKRTFPPLSRSEVLDLAGASTSQWRSYVDALPPDKKPGLTAAGRKYRITLAEAHAFMAHLDVLPRRPAWVPRALRVAVQSLKGGAGKSVISLHIAIALARRGYRVLLVDTDPQATLSRMLGIQPFLINPHETIAAAVGNNQTGPASTPLIPRGTYIDGLSIIPGALHTARMEGEILRRYREGERAGLESVFDGPLSEIDKEFDLVFIDFQPAFSMAQMFLLWASDSLLIPLPTETGDFAGTGDFLHQVADFMRPIVPITGHDKVWDPAMIIHSKRKKGNELVFNMAGAVFEHHRPTESIDDAPSISSSLAVLLSVFESNANQYNMPALRRARTQYESVTSRFINAVEERWAEAKPKDAK